MIHAERREYHQNGNIIINHVEFGYRINFKIEEMVRGWTREKVEWEETEIMERLVEYCIQLRFHSTFDWCCCCCPWAHSIVVLCMYMPISVYTRTLQIDRHDVERSISNNQRIWYIHLQWREQQLFIVRLSGAYAGHTTRIYPSIIYFSHTYCICIRVCVNSLSVATGYLYYALLVPWTM